MSHFLNIFDYEITSISVGKLFFFIRNHEISNFSYQNLNLNANFFNLKSL